MHTALLFACPVKGLQRPPLKRLRGARMLTLHFAVLPTTRGKPATMALLAYRGWHIATETTELVCRATHAPVWPVRCSSFSSTFPIANSCMLLQSLHFTFGYVKQGSKSPYCTKVAAHAAFTPKGSRTEQALLYKVLFSSPCSQQHPIPSLCLPMKWPKPFLNWQNY